MAAQGLEMPPSEPPCPFVEPILCAEFPRSGTQFAAVLSPEVNPIASWRASVWLDMPFLFLYAGLLAGAAIARAGNNAISAAALFAVGALGDVIENIGILSALTEVEAGRTVADATAAWVTGAASAKFTLLSLGVVSLGRLGWSHAA